MWDINDPYPPQEDFTCHRLDGPSTPTRRSPRRIGSRWSDSSSRKAGACPPSAQRFQVDDKTARKWYDRYRAEGAAGLEDRSSRPRHSANRTPEPLRRRVVELRRHTRRGAGFIAHATGMHASTVHRICVAEGLAASTEATAAPARLVRWCTSTSRTPSDPRRRRLAHPRTRQRRTPPTRGMALRPLRHRRPHPAGLLRDPHQRDRRHRRRVLATGRGLLRPLRDRLREGPHRQRPLLPLQRLRQGPQRHPHQPQTHPTLPAPNQRQSRAFPPHPQRGMGLRPRLGLRHPTMRRPPALHAPLQ